jgi:hypothetical protein
LAFSLRFCFDISLPLFSPDALSLLRYIFSAIIFASFSYFFVCRRFASFLSRFRAAPPLRFSSIERRGQPVFCFSADTFVSFSSAFEFSFSRHSFLRFSRFHVFLFAFIFR